MEHKKYHICYFKKKKKGSLNFFCPPKQFHLYKASHRNIMSSLLPLFRHSDLFLLPIQRLRTREWSFTQTGEDLVFLSSGEILLNTKLIKLIERIIQIYQRTGQNTTKIPKLIHQGAAGAKSPRTVTLKWAQVLNLPHAVLETSEVRLSSSVPLWTSVRSLAWIEARRRLDSKSHRVKLAVWATITYGIKLAGKVMTRELSEYSWLLAQTQTLWQRACAKGWSCLANKHTSGVHVMVTRSASQYSGGSASAQRIVMNNVPFTSPGLVMHKYFSGH